MQKIKAIPGWAWGIVTLAILFGLRFFLSEFQLLLASQMLIAALFALSLNLIMGYGGMVHFGHAAFYGLGAYTVAILATRYHASPFLGILLAPVVSAAIAVVVGWFCVRRVRLYFSILTLAFGQILYVIVFQAYDFTGGDNGLHGLPVPDLIATAANYYLFTLIIFAACFAAFLMLTKAPFVLILRAIRENPERAQFIGVNVRQHQLATFVIGAAFAGVAGALMAELNRFVAPEMLFWTTSSEPILASLMGGMFSLVGPAVGAALLLFLNIFITQYTEFWPTVLGLLTVIVVLIAPTGLVGLANRLLGAAHAEE
jgi:branched-chain amino acid transport system permease protein